MDCPSTSSASPLIEKYLQNYRHLRMFPQHPLLRTVGVDRPKYLQLTIQRLLLELDTGLRDVVLPNPIVIASDGLLTIIK